jgi:enoyl-CoA hydratase
MDYIQYERRGFVGILTIDRQNAFNALNAAVLEELERAFDLLRVQEIRCVILTGAGEKSFVAGADIGEMRVMSRLQATAWGRTGNRVMRKIETFPVPVIAAVNGFALGGGCELALACDIRLASDNALFSQPEVSLGIIPGFGGTQRLPRLIGPGRAKELLYTSSRIKADEALGLGLVNAVYPRAQLMDECMKLAEKIAANAPIAVRAVKRAVDEGLQEDLDTGIGLEAELFGDCFETEDQNNAMTAFINKQKPAPFVNK